MPATATAPLSYRPQPAPAWDSEVFVLRGDGRPHLRERVLGLTAFLDRLPDVAPPDLAATLAADLQPGGAQLAVVAGTAADLAAKLRRAADRLADPRCVHIRDTAGIYFTDRPLHAPGSLALLFPGEGAQYPGMLADLCGVFTEV